MDEVSNFCTGDICQLRSDEATTPEGTLSVAQLRDDPPWVRGRVHVWGTHCTAVPVPILHGGLGPYVQCRPCRPLPSHLAKCYLSHANALLHAAWPHPQVCHLDCWEASDINDTQRAWLNPPYDVSNSLSRLPLGYKVRWGASGWREWDESGWWFCARPRVQVPIATSLHGVLRAVACPSSWLLAHPPARPPRAT